MKDLRRVSSATLVRNGLAQEELASHRQIRERMSVLARSLGGTWEAASLEAAAGMVLLALARNNDLNQFLNSNGWKLVVSFITANPEIAKNISPRTIGEIFSYQAVSRALQPARC